MLFPILLYSLLTHIMLLFVQIAKSRNARLMRKWLFSVDDPMLTHRVSVGDRCIWSGHPCTVRFIGYLKGHASIYAGVEFVSFPVS